MKKRWLGIAVLSLGAVVAFKASGLTLGYITHGPSIAVGIGAKLLCSAEYVMGTARERAFDDVKQYSPILEMLDVEYDDAHQSVSASFLGTVEKSATFIEGLGCAIDFSPSDARRSLVTRTLPISEAEWPAGDGVSSIDPAFQHLADDIVQADNVAGLNTRAFVIVHQGRVVAESYAQGIDRTTPLLGWSMAKSLTSIMLGSLDARGLLDVNSPPGFDAWRNDARSAITLQDMLRMSDGLAFTEDYEPGDDVTIMLFDAPSASDHVLKVAQADKAPGTYFNYSSGTANLLSRVYQDKLGGRGELAEHVVVVEQEELASKIALAEQDSAARHDLVGTNSMTKSPETRSAQDKVHAAQLAYDDFIANIYIPMGFQHGTLEVDAAGTFVGSSYFYASALDWARLGQLMLNGGELNGHRIVSEDWVRRSIESNSSVNDRAYGYQWWLNRGNEVLEYSSLPEDFFMAAGNRKQYVGVFPSQDLVIVRLGWTGGGYPMEANFARVLSALD